MVLDFVMHGLDVPLEVLLRLRLVVTLGTLQVFSLEVLFSVLLEEELLGLSLDVHSLHVASHAARGARAVRTV